MPELYDTFCPRCGSDLPAHDRRVVFDYLWDPPRDEIARRVRVDTKEQLVQGRITVRYDQQALLLGDGRIVQVLEPGAHTFEASLGDRLAGGGGPRRYEFLLVDRSEIPLSYAFARVRAKDGIPCHVDLRLVVEAEHPERLLAEGLKGVRSLTRETLRFRLASEVRDAVAEAASAWRAKEIAGERNRKDELASRVLAHLRKTFEGFGLALVRIETLSTRADALEEVREAEVARAVRHAEAEGKAAHIERDLEIHRRKAAAWAELRKSVYEARKEKYRDVTDLLAHIREQKRRIREAELIDEKELDALAASVRFAKEDRERARAFLLRRIEAEEAYELGQLAAKRKLADLELQVTEARTADDIERLEIAREDQRENREIDRKARDRGARVEAYRMMKQAKADAAATRLEAGRGLAAEAIAALLAHEEPDLAIALKGAFAHRDAEARSALERGHAEELRAILEAARAQDTTTIQTLIEKLAGALASATRERAEAGDREAQATLETLRIVGSPKR